MEVATWNGPNIHRTSQRARAAQRGSRALREGPAARAGAWRPRRVATQLMVELARRDARAGHDRRRRRRARRRRRSGCATRASRRCSACRSRASARPRSSSALGFGVEPTPTTASTSPCPHFRRDDVTREADLIEEVARHRRPREAARDAARAPRRGRAAHAARSALRRRAEDALVGRGLHEIVGWSFTEPGARRPPAAARGDRRCARRRAREPDVRGPVGPAHDAARLAARRRARTTSRTAPATCALFESGRRLPWREPAAAERRCRDEHHALGGAARSARAARRATLARRPSRRAADFFAAKGCSRAVLDALRVDWSRRARRPSRSCTRAAARAIVASPATSRVGWLGELHPLVARAWDLDGAVAAFEIDLGAARRRAAPGPDLRATCTSFPALRQDLAVVVPDDVAAAAVARASSARAGGDAARRRARSSTSTAASRSARARVSLALRLAVPRAATGRSPTRTSRRVRERDRRRAARRARRRAAWLTSRPRRRRVRASPARSPRGSLDRHPRFELVARHVAPRRRPPAGRPLPAPPRAADARGARPRPPRATLDAAIVAYPHGAAAPVVAALRERGRQGRRPQRRLPPARLARRTSAGTASTRAPELLDDAVYGLPELLPRGRSRDADLVANPGCYPTAALLALAPLARAGLIADVVDRRQDRRLGRRARADRRRRTSSSVDENVTPYGSARHRHTPEIDQELARARRAASPR